MNLNLTKRGDYAVRAALHLAASWRGGVAGPYAKVREISSEMDLPRSYTPQVLGLLVRAGLVEARAGRDGGYRLVRPPSKISLLEVVEAAEGPLTPAGCTLRGGPCRWEDVCAVHPFWADASRALRDSLAATSLAQVTEVDRGLEAGLGPAVDVEHGAPPRV